MKSMLRLVVLFTFLLVSPFSLAVTCDALFTKPAQSWDINGRLTMYNNSRIYNSIDGQLPFVNSTPDPLPNNSCRSIPGPDVCSITGTSAAGRDTFTFQVSSSNEFIQANNGEQIVLGEAPFNGNEFGAIQINGGRVEFSANHSEYKVGSIQINNSSARLTFPEGIFWVNGIFTLNDGRVELSGSGTATVMVKDHFEVNSGNGRINNNGDPKRLLFYSGQTTRFNDGRIWATVFADNDFVMNNGSELNGAVNGKNVVMNDGDINGVDVTGIDFSPICGDEPPLLPDIPQTCPSPETIGAGVTWSTFDSSAVGHTPAADATEFQQLINTYANDTYLFGSSIVDEINGGGTDINPHSSQQDYYISTFTGYIEAPEDGIYEFAIDGDDAVEVLIDGQVITGWYGEHARAGSPQFPAQIGLEQGFHRVEFRHQELAIEEYFYLYWKTPSDIANGANFTIVPTDNLSTCFSTKPPIIPECPVPVAGLDFYTFDKPPGAPLDAAQFQTLVDNYGRLGTEQGRSVVATIDGSGNPHGADDYFLSRFIGYIHVPETGQYKFAVDGDDAVELLIDGEVITGWYGAHGDCNYCTTYQASVGLEAGYHEIEYRHEEESGSNAYRLLWQAPSDSSFSIVADAVLERCPPPTYEWGRTEMNNGSGSVTFSNDYLGITPLVFVMPTIVYPDALQDGPASVAVRNVTSTGFDIVQLEAPNRYTNQPGQKPMVDVDYFVTLPGRVQMPGGGEFEAGTIETQKYQGKTTDSGTGRGGWEALSFDAVFATTPAVLGQIQSNNNPDLWKTTVIRNVTGSGAQLAIEMSEVPGRTNAQGRPTSPETIAYLAGTGSGSFQSNSETILYEFGRGRTHGNNGRTRDLDQQCEYLNSHINDYIDPPVLVANKNSRDGSDGGWLRRCQNFRQAASFVTDEDQANDRDRAHLPEDVGYIALTYRSNTDPIYDFIITASPDALTCRVQEIGIRVEQNGVLVGGYLGDIQINTDTDNGIWSAVDANGVLQDLGNGDIRYSFNASDGGEIVLGLDNVVPETVTITVSDGLSSNSAAVTFRAKGFFAEITPWHDPSFAIPNQLAGQPFNLVLTAVGDDPSQSGCEPLIDFEGAKSLEMWQGYVDPDPAAGLLAEIDGVALGVGEANAVSIAAEFALGVATLSNVTYWDAGKISLHAKDLYDTGDPPADTGDEILQGSSEILFSPQSLRIDKIYRSGDITALNPSGTADSGDGFVAADAPFDMVIQALAVDGATVTSSYRVGLALTRLRDTPSNSNAKDGILRYVDGEGLIAPIVPLPLWAPPGASLALPETVFDKGIATISSLYFSEVGSIQIGIDSGDWQVTGNSLTIPASTQPVIGRFYPDHFVLTSDLTTDGNSSNPLCVAGFSYMGDEALTVEYQVEAVSANGTLTKNYDYPTLSYDTGTLGLAAEDSSDGVDLGGRLVNVIAADRADSWKEGVYTFTSNTASLEKALTGAIDGPFPLLQLSLVVTAEMDGVNFDTLDEDADSPGDCTDDSDITSGECSSRRIGGTLDLRFGRLVTASNYGSELLALPILISVETYDGSSFITEIDDSCTIIDTAYVTMNSEPAGALDNIALLDGSGTTNAGYAEPIRQGQLQFTLSAPGEGNTGRAEIRFNLNALPFFQFEWDCANDLTSCNGLGVDNPPVAEGFFGRYRGNERVIYWRETGAN
ncbi:hypothetical protein EZV61_08275 [Corallincola luteus]|uniref:PA14 domain-containing protein n=1 Tax=Corallincola luteus TaxID=1775177 RepID=A0ABY2ALS3_9GAMM|nr:DUF6701 domain-containing protein [Corallincola luteus]TCI03535.1 hypothetical protein EZV61_08275 [Corallincola luteus]